MSRLERDAGINDMSKKAFLINALDLLVLSCLATAQPVFDLLGRNVEFLAARNLDATDIFLLTSAAVLLIPLLLSILELISCMAGTATCNCVHRIFMWVLVALLLLPPAKPVYRMIGNWHFFIVPAFAGIISETYIRFRSRGLVLAWLSPVAVVMLPALFMFHSPVRSILQTRRQPATVYPRVEAAAPIVMLVFDELPLTSLMNDRGEINALRYPNISEFAASSTWYRNASAAGDSTLHLMPAILEGRLPDPDSRLLPYAKDHPDNLFTLLGGSYRLNVVESNTRLCPEDLCGPAAHGMSRFQGLTSLFSDIGVLYLYILLPANWTRPLPDITQSWKEFSAARAGARIEPKEAEDFFRMASWDDRPQVFDRFVESIRPDSRPTFHFLHILLPHTPWEYLPSGKRHTLSRKGIRGLVGVNDQGIDVQQWLDDPWAIRQAYKKHLLQVGLVDRLVGQLTRHLKEVNLFEPSLVLITSDHGTSFQLQTSRRAPSPDTYSDIVAVPLFVKAPGQDKGIVDDSNIESVDILPTMADLLGIEVPWKTDGQSVLDRSIPPKMTKTIVLENGEKMVVDADLSKIYKSIKEKIAIFGEGPEDLFHIGRHKELIGRNVKELVVTRSPLKCSLEERAFLESVDLNSQFIPANIRGRLKQGRLRLTLPLDIAISINGIIQGVTQAYLDPGGAVRFSLVVSDSSFQAGYNQVGVYLISGSGSTLELSETAGREIPHYRWGDVLSFGADGNAKSYQAAGWSAAEEQITWTDGNRAELVLPASAPHRAICLRLSAGAYLKPGMLDKQRVRISINQRPVANWVVTSRDFVTREVTISSEMFDSNETLLTFEMPDAAIPSEIGDGPDLRRLGLAMVSLSLTSAEPGSSGGREK